VAASVDGVAIVGFAWVPGTRADAPQRQEWLMQQEVSDDARGNMQSE